MNPHPWIEILFKLLISCTAWSDVNIFLQISSGKYFVLSHTKFRPISVKIFTGQSKKSIVEKRNAITTPTPPAAPSVIPDRNMENDISALLTWLFLLCLPPSTWAANLPAIVNDFPNHVSASGQASSCGMRGRGVPMWTCFRWPQISLIIASELSTCFCGSRANKWLMGTHQPDASTFVFGSKGMRVGRVLVLNQMFCWYTYSSSSLFCYHLDHASLQFVISFPTEATSGEVDYSPLECCISEWYVTFVTFVRFKWSPWPLWVFLSLVEGVPTFLLSLCVSLWVLSVYMCYSTICVRHSISLKTLTIVANKELLLVTSA